MATDWAHITLQVLSLAGHILAISSSSLLCSQQACKVSINILMLHMIKLKFRDLEKYAQDNNTSKLWSGDLNLYLSDSKFSVHYTAFW